MHASLPGRGGARGRGLSRSASAPSRGPVRGGGAKRRTAADEEATQRRLHSILLGKVEVSEPECSGPAVNPPSSSNLLGVNEGPQNPPKKNSPSSSSYGGAGGSSAVGRSLLDLEAEKQAFMDSVCTDSTRSDVREWVSKIFTIVKTAQVAEQAGAPRRRRAGSCSDSGGSGTTFMVAGGSIATASHAPTIMTASHRPPQSLHSDESLVVHHSRGDEALSVNDRLRAYLSGNIPELTEHVNTYVAARTESLRREIDEEQEPRHMKQTSRRKVFDDGANLLRWQNARRMALQQRLDEETPAWILEAIQRWDHKHQKKAFQKEQSELSETDLIFDYLTKRAAHIDTGKLATEIPWFKPRYASYSLPRMWRDKYLS